MLPIFQEFSLLFVLLGFGYLGYVTAYAGLRRGHKAFDALFISLAFGAVAYIPFYVFEFVQLPNEFPAWRARLILFAIAIGMSIFAGLTRATCSC